MHPGCSCGSQQLCFQPHLNYQLPPSTCLPTHAWLLACPHTRAAPLLPCWLCRLSELVPAVSRVWLPWIPRLGSSSAPASSIETLRRHASRVLLPSSFHQASLVKLLGFPSRQVAVVPQPVPEEDWCPPAFEELPGRQALQVRCCGSGCQEGEGVAPGVEGGRMSLLPQHCCHVCAVPCIASCSLRI